MGFKPFIGDTTFVNDNDPYHIYKCLGDTGPLQRVADDPLILPFVKTDYEITINGKPRRLVRQRRLPFQVRIQEITRTRALASIIDIIDMCIRCLKRQTIPLDIHEGNILYWKRPYFIDLDAFKDISRENCANAVSRIAYLYFKYVFRRNVGTHETFDYQQWKKQGGWLSRQTSRDFTDINAWSEFRDIVANTATRGELVKPKRSHWSDDYAIGKDDEIRSNPKIATTLKMIDGIKPKTLLDIGCNKGYICNFTRDIVDFAFGFDIDEACIDDANARYTDARIDFGCFDLMHFNASDDHMAIPPRFVADMVVVLALTHHLSNAGLPAGTVVPILSQLAKKWILIEEIADVVQYRNQLDKNGFTLKHHLQSHPADRRLTLWERVRL